MKEFIFEKENEGKEEKVFSVSEYLDYLNSNLKEERVKIIGEVTSFQEYPERSYMYFSIKDKKDSSTIKCFMWKKDYRLSSVLLEDGLEITITAYANVYKPTGSMTMQVSFIELVGEGALKIAYEKLKKQLEVEGLFDLSNKKEIPVFPKRIGLLTSKSGAVINDFLTNIGKHGFEINFVDIKVEGADAVSSIMDGLRVLYKEKLDCLVIIRGGGSLESFQSFNNENVVRAVSKFNCPVITGLGHDKDLPLLSLMSDKNVSTPTAVANFLNKGFDMADGEVSMCRERILNIFSDMIRNQMFFVEQSRIFLAGSFDRLYSFVESFNSEIKNIFNLLNLNIEKINNDINLINKSIIQNFNYFISNTKDRLDSLSSQIYSSDPEKVLKLGFSIVRINGSVVKSVRDVKVGDNLKISLSDGKIDTKVI